MDKGFQTDVIYLDFNKAFDSVPHSLLIHRLKKIGFNGDLLIWLKSYLAGRKQQVVMEGAKSSWLSVTPILYCFKRKLVMHYDNLITYFDTDNVCTWSGICGCHSCVCNRGDSR